MIHIEGKDGERAVLMDGAWSGVGADGAMRRSVARPPQAVASLLRAHQINLKPVGPVTTEDRLLGQVFGLPSQRLRTGKSHVPSAHHLALPCNGRHTKHSSDAIGKKLP